MSSTVSAAAAVTHAGGTTHVSSPARAGAAHTRGATCSPDRTICQTYRAVRIPRAVRITGAHPRIPRTVRITGTHPRIPRTVHVTGSDWLVGFSGVVPMPGRTTDVTTVIGPMNRGVNAAGGAASGVMPVRVMARSV